jgi:hypothetical protein
LHTLPLQQPKGHAELHVHVPATQLVPAWHTFPHEPQLLLSLLITLMHVPPHFVYPPMQLNPQLVPLQVGVAFCGIGHVAQEVGPQLEVNMLLTHVPPQSWLMPD